ncbi:hypothetical protein RAA17_10585 [Komagataeibacter rhaeticus]|nr:hypothetical protein [Komagataeibacter rhaeticus]
MKIGTDLVTFYNPAFWGVTTEADITALAQADGRAFWTRLLDTLHMAGITGIELTFPFDQMGAVAAFTSEAALKHELEIRGWKYGRVFPCP